MCRRVVAREALSDDPQVGLGRGAIDAVSQPADSIQIARGPIAGSRRREVDDLEQIRIGNELEPIRGHDAHDHVRLVIQGDRAAHDLRIRREEPPPASVAQNHGAARAFVLRPERSPEGRSPPQGREEPRCHRQCTHGLRAVAPAEDMPRAPTKRGHVLEGVALRSPVGELSGRDEILRRRWRGCEERHQAMRVRERQRLPDLGFHHAEDRCRGADSHRQRQDRGRRERRLFSQQPRAVAKVLPQALERGPDPHVAGVLACEHDVAERAATGVERVAGRHPVALQLLLGHRAMDLELLGQLDLQTPGTEPVLDAAKESLHSVRPFRARAGSRRPASGTPPARPRGGAFRQRSACRSARGGCCRTRPTRL